MLVFAGGFLFGSYRGSVESKNNKSESDSSSSESVETRLISSPESETSKEVSDPRDFTREEWATIQLFEKAAPSVAFITTSNYRMNYWTRDVTEIPRGSGSGFVWDREGHIVTNFHVIENADKAIVTLADQSTWDAEPVGTAPEKDLAVLKIKAPRKHLSPVPLGSSQHLRVGQSVYAIGNPFGLDQTLTTGIISALDREIKSGIGRPIRDVIQTDAAINPGNSGGPLLNSKGELIGVNTAIYSPSGAYAGIGFSIPADVVQWAVPDLIEHGRLIRPSLGVTLARQSQVSRAGLEGAVVLDVMDGTAAQKAGLRPTGRNQAGQIELGDIIVGVGETKVSNNDDLFLALETYEAGDQILLRVLRGKREVDLEVVLDPPSNR
ncbi:MAG: trypsin-like peptidase domain-containing protein [Saprospiraceae bacterium]|nr:trypsin-like peptidase domain-containing protein [Saprospiraceae bacterium]